LLSEAGLPCIADPGNLMVKWCHEKNIRVIPISGPSSIILALFPVVLMDRNLHLTAIFRLIKAKRKTDSYNWKV
jgi:16S rRNA C1402 (ribose-2'-O) methylase RsmI